VAVEWFSHVFDVVSFWSLEMSTSPSITREDVRSWSPCAAGTDEFIESCFGDRESLSFQDLCEIPHLCHEHLLWTALRPQVISSEKLEVIRLKFLRMIGESHPHFADWFQLSAVDLIGKVVRANLHQSPEETYSQMVAIMKEHHAK
jgi:hypothetical protein